MKAIFSSKISVPPSGWRHHLLASLSLGAPLVLANLAQATLNATDVMMMGRLGADALAAGALALALYHACMVFGMGVVAAPMPLIASALGRRKRPLREVRLVVHHGLWNALLVCLPMWVLLWQAEWVLLRMGQAPAAAREAGAFMHLLQWALLPYLCYLVLRALLAALHLQRWTLLVTVAAIAVNAGLAWALMFGQAGLPAMGLRGAGVASALASTFMCVGLAAVALWHPQLRPFHLLRHDWQPLRQRLAQQWRLGLPIALTFAFEVSVFYAAVMMMGRIGEAELAAHSVAVQVATLSFMVPMSFGQVATLRVAKALGERQGEQQGARQGQHTGNDTGDDTGHDLRLAGWSAFVLGVGFMALMALAMLTVPTLLLRAFLNVDDPASAELVSLAVHFLAMAALFQVADGAQTVASGMLRGLHDTRVPMLLAGLGYWGIGIPLGAWLAFGDGLFGTPLRGTGVWLGLLAGLGATALLMTWRWWQLSRPQRLAQSR